MNMYRWAHLVVTVVLIAASGIACSENEQPTLDKPPTAAQTEPTERIYDYTHSIQHHGNTRLARKFVVALVRFGDDRPVDDVPYGAASSEPKSPATQSSTNVDVNVKVNSPDVRPNEKLPPGMSQRSREMLKRELMETDSFVLVERERILDILREQKFGQTRYVNDASSPEMGEILAVQYLIEGSVGLNEDRTLKDTVDAPPTYKEQDSTLAERIFNPGRAAQRSRLRELEAQRCRMLARRNMERENCISAYLSMYDVRTGQIAAEGFGIGGNALEAIRDAVEDLLDKCLDIPNPIRVAAVSDDQVYLDAGHADGMSIGQRFRYVNPGPAVRNHAGQTIGAQEEEGGELEITRVEKLMSVAKVTRLVSQPEVGARTEPLD